MASALRVLFIGGSGIISSACCRLAVQRGIDLYALNRGATQLRALPAEVTILHGDVRDPGSVRDALGGLEFDVVVNWVAFTQDHIEADLELFRGKISQYIFISSASAYQTPPARVPVTESTPLSNPYWHYSRDKIACEELFYEAYREQDFPLTVVRPSHTYDRTKIALVGGWTDIHRMRAGLPVMVHGDGTSLWTLTHSRDFAKAFVGLLGRPQAVGESYTITSDEYLPWNQIYQLFARAAGVSKPELVHVASETIAAHSAELGPNLLGDRSHSVVFDNTKIKSLVPDYCATIPFADGAREIVNWYDANPGLQVVNQQFMDLSDQLIGWARRGA